MEWPLIPEAALLHILKYLDYRDITRCGLCCKRWYAISQDNLLWKQVLVKDFKLKRSSYLKSSENCEDGFAWKEEYIRLKDTPPSITTQVLRGHVDEVLHAAFSHDGRQLASCSKDRRVIVWNRDESGHFSEHFRHDMGQFNWLHVWAAQFSPNDSKLMVAGVVNEVGGELAIFKTGRGITENYEFLCRVVNDPYDVLGCWLSDRYFLSGTISADFFADLEASIWLCESPDGPNDLQEAIEAGNPGLFGLPGVVPEGGEIPQNNGLPQLSLSCYKALLFRFRNLDSTVYLRYVQTFSRKMFSAIDRDEIEWLPLNIADNGDNGENDENGGQEFEQTIEDGECEKAVVEQELCTVFFCGDKTTIPHQLGFFRLTPNRLRFPPNLQKPEKVIELHGHVIGMAISPDNRKLYVNVRSWPENAVPSPDQPPPIATSIDMRVIDLQTLEVTKETFTGHYGYTPSEKAFYLYMDISADFVASGSENCKGCLWDKKSGGLLTTFNHDACVNCVAFGPLDQELCVTASDDSTIKVWKSRRAIRSES